MASARHRCDFCLYGDRRGERTTWHFPFPGRKLRERHVPPSCAVPRGAAPAPSPVSFSRLRTSSRPPQLPLLSVLPGSPPGRSSDVSPPAGRWFEAGSIICVGSAPGAPAAAGHGEENRQSPTKSWTFVQPAPSCQNLPLPFSSPFSLPSAGAVGSLEAGGSGSMLPG